MNNDLYRIAEKITNSPAFALAARIEASPMASLLRKSVLNSPFYRQVQVAKKAKPRKPRGKNTIPANQARARKALENRQIATKWKEAAAREIIDGGKPLSQSEMLNIAKKHGAPYTHKDRNRRIFKEWRAGFDAKYIYRPKSLKDDRSMIR